MNNIATKLACIVLIVVPLAISTNSFLKYLAYKDIPSGNAPIKYLYFKKEIHQGRGRSYQMQVSYLQKTYTVNITGDTYHRLDKQMPSLYYSPNDDQVFSLWETKRYFRLALVFAGVFLAMLIVTKKQLLS